MSDQLSHVSPEGAPVPASTELVSFLHRGQSGDPVVPSHVDQLFRMTDKMPQPRGHLFNSCEDPACIFSYFPVF